MLPAHPLSQVEAQQRPGPMREPQQRQPLGCKWPVPRQGQHHRKPVLAKSRWPLRLLVRRSSQGPTRPCDTSR